MDKPKTITIKPLVVDLNKFNNYAVYVSKNFQNMCFCPALISEPKEIKKHGVLPSKSKNTFNCCIGDYYENCVDIMIYAQDCNTVARNYFKALELWTNVGDVFSKTIGCDLLDSMLENGYGYCGYFHNKTDIVSKIIKLRDSYIKELEISIKLTASDDVIKEALNACRNSIKTK